MTRGACYIIGQSKDQRSENFQRLNAALAEYQEKYPPIGLSRQGTNGDVPDTPWVLDRNLMSPLLAEYDANMQMLKEQLDTYKCEQKDLRSLVDKMVAENQRLTKELKDSLESQLASVDLDGSNVTPAAAAAAAAASVNVGVEDEEVLHNLQHQLQMALQEKDSAMEMWQASVQEVERLERELQSSQFNPRLQALEHQAAQIKHQYTQTVAELNSEISNLQDELRRSKNELKVAALQVTELRKTLEEMRNQLAKQEQEKSLFAGGKDMADNRLGTLQKKLKGMETSLGETGHQARQLQQEKNVLNQKVTELQKKCCDLEQRAYEASLQVRDSCQMAENAILEKDQALVRERQAVEEIQRLQDAITKLVEEAGSRTRQEVDNVKKQCNQNMSRLMEEIHGLELETSEKQAQIDRAIREKRAVESELEKIYQEGVTQGSKDNSAYDDMNRRACTAERLRDEALVKMDGMRNDVKRMEMTYKQEKNHLAAEVEQLRDRLVTMNQEFDSANDDRVRLMEQMDELKKKVYTAQQERDSAQRQLNKEVTCMGKDKHRTEKDYEVKVKSLEDGHRHSSMELRSMLASQQRMSAKWKEECQSITQKFEVKVGGLREELSREKKRMADLTKLLKESRDKTADVEQMLVEYTRNIKRMEGRVREAESRAITTVQVSSHSVKNRNVVEEHKRLHRELERSLMESKASTGMDSLAVSDLATSAQHQAHVSFTNGLQDPLEDVAHR